MEDHNGLELSLGLTCGATSSNPKGKNGNNNPETKSEEPDRGTKLIDDFKTFLHGGTQNQESTPKFQETTPQKPEENFFNNLSNTAEDEKNNKRKSVFDDNNSNTKAKTSHISITTDEGSTGDNEADVADSEADASTSKRQAGSGSVSYLPAQQPVMNANLPVMFGYPAIQIPVLDKDNTGRGLISHPLQQFQVSYFGRGPLNSDKQNDSAKISQAAAATAQKSPENVDRPPEEGGGSSSHTEENPKATTTATITTIKPPGSLTSNPVDPSDYPSIRPGIATDLKFGGSGSYPNLPWVSTTGSGPNGKTISGVTYRFSTTQIKIVCACHGSHLSPEEFVQHASEDHGSNDAASGLSTFPGTNPAASAQS